MTFRFRKLGQYILPNERIICAVAAYLSFDDPDAARVVLEQGRSGSKVAQYIVGMALRRAQHHTAADGWLEMSADQGYEPAKLQQRDRAARARVTTLAALVGVRQL